MRTCLQAPLRAQRPSPSTCPAPAVPHRIQRVTGRKPGLQLAAAAAAGPSSPRALGLDLDRYDLDGDGRLTYEEVEALVADLLKVGVPGLPVGL